MKNIVSAIKNILDNINSRLDIGEQKTNKLENSNKNCKMKRKVKKCTKSKQNIYELQDNSK